jgi:chromosome segregation ATPase
VRVNITYSIELDEIPNKVSELLTEAYPDLVKLQDQIQGIDTSLKAGRTSIEDELNKIDEIRRELANVDFKMMDCAEILHGYQSALVRLREQKNKPERENVKEEVQKTEEG